MGKYDVEVAAPLKVSSSKIRSMRLWVVRSSWHGCRPTVDALTTALACVTITRSYLPADGRTTCTAQAQYRHSTGTSQAPQSQDTVHWTLALASVTITM